MRYFSKYQMQAMEQLAVEKGVTMEDLMEHAGSAAVRFIREKFDLNNKRIVILCGKGNNGGDGFVAARLFSEMDLLPTVILAEGKPASKLASQAFERMGDKVFVVDWESENRAARQAISEADLIIDGLYGFGFHGVMREPVTVLAELANRSRVPIVSLDIASGVECDTGAVRVGCIRAKYTVTFTVPKPGHILYPGREYCGEVTPVSAGIDYEIVHQAIPVLETIEQSWVRSQFHPRDSESNKGDYGKLLCVCGSEGMAGAAIMCGMAALRCGAGLVNLALPRSIYPIAASRLLESVFTLLDQHGDRLAGESMDRLFGALHSASACVIGCGLGTAPGIPPLVKLLLEKAPCPVVLDADGLNAICNDLDCLKQATAEKPVIVTPHPGEMARLLNVTAKEVQEKRLAAAQYFAHETGAITVLKGAGTLIALPNGRTYMNLTGNPGMARGGSGDILAGMVGSFAAQGMEPSAAARAAVYLHGLAGDQCAKRFSQQGMMPTDMIARLPQLFLKLEA